MSQPQSAKGKQKQLANFYLATQFLGLGLAVQSKETLEMDIPIPHGSMTVQQFIDQLKEYLLKQGEELHLNNPDLEPLAMC